MLKKIFSRSTTSTANAYTTNDIEQAILTRIKYLYSNGQLTDDLLLDYSSELYGVPLEQPQHTSSPQAKSLENAYIQCPTCQVLYLDSLPACPTCGPQSRPAEVTGPSVQQSDPIRVTKKITIRTDNSAKLVAAEVPEAQEQKKSITLQVKTEEVSPALRAKRVLSIDRKQINSIPGMTEVPITPGAPRIITVPTYNSSGVCSSCKAPYSPKTRKIAISRSAAPKADKVVSVQEIDAADEVEDTQQPRRITRPKLRFL